MNLSTSRKKLPLLLLLAFLFSQCSLFKIPEEERSPYAGREEGGAIATTEDRLRMDIIQYAEQFLGTPYQYGGMSPKTGFDCSGFTAYVLNRYDINVSHSSAAQEKEGKKVRLKDVQPGDLIFYRRGGPLSKVFHVSMVAENDSDGITVIHSVNSGVIKENITTSSYWAPLVSSARTVISR